MPGNGVYPHNPRIQSLTEIRSHFLIAVVVGSEGAPVFDFLPGFAVHRVAHLKTLHPLIIISPSLYDHACPETGFSEVTWIHSPGLAFQGHQAGT